jgi:hypothetical protein
MVGVQVFVFPFDLRRGDLADAEFVGIEDEFSGKNGGVEELVSVEEEVELEGSILFELDADVFKEGEDLLVFLVDVLTELGGVLEGLKPESGDTLLGIGSVGVADGDIGQLFLDLVNSDFLSSIEDLGSLLVDGSVELFVLSFELEVKSLEFLF